MSLLVLGLAGCTTYGDSYYRDGYYSDGGYYYPAEDGYGDYYQGPEYVDYYYSSYTPFWRLDRYYCSAYYSCSPYWNNYYRRPYSGWSISYGRGWGLGSSGWYGNYWSPWYGHGRYGHYDRYPVRRDYDRDRRRDRDPPAVTPVPRDNEYRRPRPDFREDGRVRPRPNDSYARPRPADGVVRPAPRPIDGVVRPAPRTSDGFNDRPVPVRRVVEDNPAYRKTPVPMPPDRSGAGPVPRGFDRAPPPPRASQPSAPPVRAERPAPPPQQRAAPPEVRPASQNRSTVDEQ